jgi:hypothetical protein
MGFLSKVLHKLTGGAAEVTLDAPPARPGESTTITGTVTVKGEPVEIDGATIEIRCRQTIPAIDYDLTDGITPPPTHLYSAKQQETVAGAQVLAAGSTHTWTATFEISDGAVTTGYNFDWQARLVVDAEGNDPDSGWVEFAVS